MRIVTEEAELQEIEKYMKVAAEEAMKSNCKKSKRGAVIVNPAGEIIGKAHNEALIEKYCNPCVRENVHDNRVVEICSAIHAEENAILVAFKRGYLLHDSTLYHMKAKDGKFQPSGAPSCTSCSKSILVSDISYVVLFHKKGTSIGGNPPLENDCYIIYDAEEFNKLSHKYFEKR